MTHLAAKMPFAPKPYEVRTRCGRTVKTTDVVGESPECETCHNPYLQDLEDEQGEYEAMCADLPGLREVSELVEG